ncbi:cytochrome c oxidase assembly factor Coa1 family protein [Marinoscillum pacificum]|uniref:cytochrome c oxidase assembly factor Coa1 family protein n=1 Tax=Marinoscillum pacificum TaxID=392723 RepID=UPI0021570105|nr:cytochrome c oxidase assembly factor Coa1 family protein [Marinoscillum pacificum]
MDIKNFWHELHPVIKILTIAGLVFMIYGLIARNLEIYFFWESSTVGFAFLAGSIGVVLITELLIKIGIFKAYFRSGWQTALHILFVILFVTVNSIFLFSDALKVAKEQLRESKQINDLVGEINSFGWLVTGSSSITTNSGRTFGSAEYQILVKGDEGYRYVTVTLTKRDDQPWNFKLTGISR